MVELTTALAVVSLGAWLWLLLARGSFWRATERLGHGDPAQQTWPAVVAVIPARDEADVIARALDSVLGQDYPGPLSAVVVDDSSTDATKEAARSIVSARHSTVVTGQPLPPGWTGKLWALEQGIAHARRTVPDARYLWFTDADIEHGPTVLRRLVAKATSGDFDLVSLMVLLHYRTVWERLLIPPFVFFFQKLYPFPWVNDSRARTAAAAGGCIVLRRDALARIGGLAAIKHDLIDDCALACAVKRGGAIWLGLTHDSRSLRAYGDLSEIWAMVARTAFHQLRYSTVLLAATVLAMVLIYVVPPAVAASWPWHGSGPALLSGALAFFMMALAYRPTLRFYGGGAWATLLLPVAAAFYAAMTLDSARRHWFGRGGTWKARHYAPEA